MTTHTGTITRDGKWWMVSIPKIDGLTQVRRLEHASQAALELIAVTLDIPISKAKVTLTMQPIAGVDIQEAVSRIAADRDAAARASSASTELAKALTAAGVPQRDIATLLSVSYQRVGQLVTERKAS